MGRTPMSSPSAWQSSKSASTSSKTALEKERDLTERTVELLEDEIGEQLAGYDLPDDDLRGFQ